MPIFYYIHFLTFHLYLWPFAWLRQTDSCEFGFRSSSWTKWCTICLDSREAPSVVIFWHASPDFFWPRGQRGLRIIFLRSPVPNLYFGIKFKNFFKIFFWPFWPHYFVTKRSQVIFWDSLIETVNLAPNLKYLIKNIFFTFEPLQLVTKRSQRAGNSFFVIP